METPKTHLGSGWVSLSPQAYRKDALLTWESFLIPLELQVAPIACIV